MNCNLEIYYCLQNNTISFPNPLLKYLSQEEIDRAAKFVSPKDQMLYLISHAFLKNKLSAKTGINPKDLVFTLNQYGKPSLSNNNVFFNLSHSKDSWCMAFSENYEIGIDIEEIKENKDFHDILPLFFTIHEQNKILDAKNSVTEFYKLWTRKEAVLKAMGVGLNFKLNEIDVCNNKIKNDSLNVPDLHIKSYKKNNSFISIATTLIPQIRLFEVSNINFLNFFSA